MTRSITATADNATISRERRKAPRKRLNLPVQLAAADKSTQACTVTHISLCGMFLHSREELPGVGDSVALTFSLPYSGIPKRCQLAGNVICVGTNGFAIEFQRFDTNLFRYVHKLMHETDALSAADEPYSSITRHGYVDQNMPGDIPFSTTKLRRAR